MVAFQSFKVRALPLSPQADAVYYVRPGAGPINLFVTDSQGTSVPVKFNVSWADILNKPTSNITASRGVAIVGDDMRLALDNLSFG
jgi:hypothetical protein